MKFLHPTDLALSLFASDDLPPRAHVRVARHLGRCEACFSYVAALRSTSAVAKALAAPRADEADLVRIRARREAGERVILPSAVAGLPRASYRVAWPIVAAAVLLITVLFFSSARDLPAGAVESELIITPEAPQPGDRVSVTYRPIPSLFVREDRLILRGGIHTPRSESYGRGIKVVVLDTLMRDGSGAFRGTFALADSVVFVSMAVEDTRAAVVDDRTGRPWEVLLHGPDGKPTFEALAQRENHYMGRSWEEAYATARRKAELYPEQMRSWSHLEFFESQVLGKAAADSAAAARLPHIQALLAAYTAAPSVSAEELDVIVFRAYAQGDTAAWDYWYDRILREAPHHEQTVQQATVRAVGKYPRNPAKWDERLLADFEEIWLRHGPVTGSGHLIFQAALGASKQANNVTAYRRWAHRLMTADPSVTRYYGARFLRYAELRSEGLDILRGQLMAVERDARPLDMTREAHARAIAAERRRILAAIGRGLLDSGNARGGLDTLALAVNDGWDLALFQEVASGRTKAGDTAGALEIHAKIAADPRTSVAHRDSMATLGARMLGATPWTSLVAEARRFMIETVMAASTVRLVLGEPSLIDGAGQPIRLRDLIADKPALVVYWSRFCAPALGALARIDSTATILRSQGAAAFLIVDEPPSAELAAFLKERNVVSPVYHDVNREVANAFRNFGTPAYYVLDPAGRIRFTRASTEDELVVQITAVRAEQPGGNARSGS